ncbi:hypothetical protein [Horticoccus sp. 23ND18S-11]|uniref:hypothetical protein n=1 Tax=Horticoccus sp. 23ND18S-11 TaxID=3391832 RepID=UPI0039C9906A
MTNLPPVVRSAGRGKPAAPRGFALLLVITLLAFIVLLLVGLATYTRIETAVAGNTQRQSQARENALLALNVALGQLQANAGADTRVTAAAAGVPSVHPQKRYYTGVWNTTATEFNQPVWLVSGVETGAAQDVTQATTPAANQVMVVATNTDGSAAAQNVMVPLQNITVPGVPGQTGSVLVGKYAWWVGDQGIKAPVAVGDGSEGVTYEPFTSNELRSRIRQQLAIGAGAADASGNPQAEPRDANNASLMAEQKIATPGQLAFLRSPTNATLGLATGRTNFHAWSPNNFAVIANTKLGGLKQDLSLMPELLGTPFTAWADYPTYMEKPAAAGTVTNGEGTSTASPAAPTILPEYGADPVRRRYLMTAQNRTGNTGGSHQVAPILTYFLLSFNVRTQPTPAGNPSSGVQPLQVRARWMASLWNPYSSALVPENLQIDITGLPTVEVINDDMNRAGRVASVSTQSAFGLPFRVNLPWNSTGGTATSPMEDRQSWLPGRVYTWRSKENLDAAAAVPATGFDSDFYSRTLNDGGAGVVRALPGTAVDGDDPCHLVGTSGGQLRIRLYLLRADGTRVQLGDFRSPAFKPDFETAPEAINKFGHQFSYVFRLQESVHTPATPGAWLTTPQRDFRMRQLSGDHFVVGPEGDDPALYSGSYSTISNPDLLLDRAENAWSFDQDVPVFELPRGPILSMGALQHFRIIGSRPFMIGNPWGVDATLNGIALGELFDRFYFSGATKDVLPEAMTNGDLLLPNPLLRTLRNPDGSKPTVDDLRGTVAGVTPPAETGDPVDDDSITDETPTTGATTVASLPGGRSSKFFLQGGAFNLNSTNAAAWRAVLRGVRFPAPQAFTYLDLDPATGTAGDGATASVTSSDAQFFRFSQSAQETYKPESDTDDSVTKTRLFRQGMRTLEAQRVASLATRIAALVAAKIGAEGEAGGPFRSVQEFLSPSILYAGVDGNGNAGAPRSLLEAAIADEAVNEGIEFSSQYLTQADIMTALAPVLFARSDTFLIRAYGEAVNPATSATEGRAWCEALVQRVPEYFADPANTPPETDPATFGTPSDPADPASVPTAASQLNAQLGRRFKIVSFRWLTRSDI